jgi:heme-degrading monooxygenase HmoA
LTGITVERNVTRSNRNVRPITNCASATSGTIGRELEMDVDADGGRTLDRPTIARVWRGATREEDSRAYRDALRADLREVRSVKGNLGAFVLERTVDGRAEFQFVSLWESMDAVAGFAGSDVDRAVYFRDDERVLLELTPRVEHYDVVAVETCSRFGELPGAGGPR